MLRFLIRGADPGLSADSISVFYFTTIPATDESYAP